MTAYLVTTTTTIKQNVLRCDVGARFLSFFRVGLFSVYDTFVGMNTLKHPYKNNFPKNKKL